VANFIGDVNIIEGSATQGEAGRVAIAYAEGAAPIEAVSAEPLSPGQKVFYAVRPEKIAVSAEPMGERANSVRGQIVDIAYLGNLSTYHVRLGSGQIVKASMTNARRLQNRPFTWEDEVWLSWTNTAGVVLTR